jgi:diadenosine tetraphosphate (Ap4A) HIT family hydrolase
MKRGAKRTWPDDWERRVQGESCPVCAEGRPDEADGRLRVYQGRVVDAYLNRDEAALGYVVAFWRGPHVVEATQLSDADAAQFWRELLHVSRGIELVLQPAKLNFLLLGNSVPHLHAHIVPRYVDDPDPGRPPRFMMGDATWTPIEETSYLRHVEDLRAACGSARETI